MIVLNEREDICEVLMAGRKLSFPTSLESE